MFTGDLFAAVNNFIDDDVTQKLTDEGCRHALKASAWRVIKGLNQSKRSRAFAAAVARKSRSIALAVFSTALALTADVGNIDERDLVRRLEPDGLTRADALKTQPGILNIIFASSGLAPPPPTLAPQSSAA